MLLLLVRPLLFVAEAVAFDTICVPEILDEDDARDGLRICTVSFTKAEGVPVAVATAATAAVVPVALLIILAGSAGIVTTGFVVADLSGRSAAPFLLLTLLERTPSATREVISASQRRTFRCLLRVLGVSVYVPHSSACWFAGVGTNQALCGGARVVCVCCWCCSC